jgi:hypothetical protein
MAQAVRRRPPRRRPAFDPVSIHVGFVVDKWRWDRVFPSAWFSPCQFHSTGVPLLGKGQKIIVTDTPSRRYWCCMRAKNRRTKFCYHRIPDVTCRHAAKVICVQRTDTLFVFKKSKLLQTSRASLSTQLLHWSQFCILRSHDLDFNCWAQ